MSIPIQTLANAKDHTDLEPLLIEQIAVLRGLYETINAENLHFAKELIHQIAEELNFDYKLLKLSQTIY